MREPENIAAHDNVVAAREVAVFTSSVLEANNDPRASRLLTRAKLLSALFQRPLVNVNYVVRVLGVSFPTANRLVARFEELGLLREVTGQKRGRLFRYEPYLRLFDDAET